MSKNKRAPDASRSSLASAVPENQPKFNIDIEEIVKQNTPLVNLDWFMNARLKSEGRGRRLLAEIRTFYEDPENVAEFDAWLAAGKVWL